MIAMQRKALEKLKIKYDDNEQYSRKSCLRFHGIEFNPNDDSDGVMNKIEKCYGNMGLEFNESKIDRAHYIGKPNVDKNTKTKYKSIIVKFKSWKLRMAFYKARPKSYVERKTKPGVKFSVSLDLKKRNNLLKIASNLTKNKAAVSYVFELLSCYKI